MCNKQAVRLTREELYKMVWTQPVTKWAEEFGLSNVGFAKKCKKMKVPLPGRGYWAMIQKGLKLTRPALKPVHDSKYKTIEIIKREPKAAKVKNVAESDPSVLFEMMPENKVLVPERIASKHPLIRMTEISLKDRGIDQYGRIISGGLSCLNIHVSKESLRRAINIMDTLIKALEKREMKVFVKDHRNQNTMLSILGEELEFRIEEPSTKVEHQKTKSEIQKAILYPTLYGHTTYDYVCTGNLHLSIMNYTRETIRRSWRDTESRQIEDCLNEIIIGFIKAAGEIKKDRLAREKEEKERLERKRLYEAIQRQKAEEEKRFNDLLIQVNSWTKSNAINGFVNHVKAAVIEKYGEIEIGSDIEKWLVWANMKAQLLDPTSKLIGQQIKPPKQY